MLHDRAHGAVDDLPHALVYAGFSLGGAAASDDAWIEHDPWIAERKLHHVLDWLPDRSGSA